VEGALYIKNTSWYLERLSALEEIKRKVNGGNDMESTSPYQQGTLEGVEYFFDPNGGSLAITFREGQPDHIKELDNLDVVYWADRDEQQAIGVDIVNAREADLSGLPEQDYIRRVLEHLGLPVPA
jgi:hypothetical protein